MRKVSLGCSKPQQHLLLKEQILVANCNVTTGSWVSTNNVTASDWTGWILNSEVQLVMNY